MTTVIKIGGSLLGEDGDLRIVRKIAQFRKDRVVLVHGGGPAVTSLCSNLGIESRFVTSPGGIRSRLTDLETVQAYVMAMRGKINAGIVLEMQKYGSRSFGMSGIDGPTLVAERKKRLLTINERGRKMFIDGGYTGRIVNVDPSNIIRLLEAGFTPVIAPIAVSEQHEPLNIDGDRAASAVSSSLKADRLILLTNVDGVMLGGRIIEEISLKELDEVMKKVGNGMDKKLLAAKEAISGGTSEVIIANGSLESPVESAIESGVRTVIRK